MTWRKDHIYKEKIKNIFVWYSKSVFIGHTAEFCKSHELRMCNASSWMSYKPTLFQNQFAKYLIDDFWKHGPKRLPTERHRKPVTEHEIDFQSLLFHCLMFLQSLCSSESPETNSSWTLSPTWQHLIMEPVSSGQNEDGTWWSNISEPKKRTWFFFINISSLQQKHKWKPSTVFRYFQDRSISPELTEKFSKRA